MSARDTHDREKPIDRLLDIVSRLRGEHGCPWDREQSLESLKPCLIEESYEVLDAVDDNDPDRHREELGDVLLQVLLHAQIRKEQGDFTFDDVAAALAEKLVRRHPHVFGDVKVSGTDQVLRNWEAIKSRETKGGARSALEGVPKHLPALHKAERVQSRAARVGFDWKDVADVIRKVEEELAETRRALEAGDQAGVREEIGDLLFAVVNLCRFQQIHPEEALKGTVDKFVRRFQEIERRFRRQGRELAACSLEEMDAEWEAVKKEERTG